MAEGLGKLALVLEADDRGLKAGLKSAEKQAEKTGKAIGDGIDKGAKKASSGVDGLSNRARDASGKFVKLGNEASAGLGKVAAKASGVGVGVNKLGDRVRDANGRFVKMGNDANRSLGNVAKGADTAKASMGRLGAAIATTFSVAAIGYFTQQLFGVGVAADQVRAKFTNIFKGQELGARELAWTRKEADRLGVSIDVVQKGWGNFAASGGNVSLEQRRKLFSEVTEEANKYGLSSAELEGTLLSLTQMMNKEKLSMEEILQYAERMPGGLSMFARALSMTEAEFVEAVSTGKLLASDVLPKLNAELAKTGPGAETAAQKVNRLQNEFKYLQETASLKLVDGFVGVSDAVSAIISNVQGNEQAMADWSRTVWNLQMAWDAVSKALAPIIPDMNGIDIATKAVEVALSAAADATTVFKDAVLGIITAWKGVPGPIKEAVKGVGIFLGTSVALLTIPKIILAIELAWAGVKAAALAASIASKGMLATLGPVGIAIGVIAAALTLVDWEEAGRRNKEMCDAIVRDWNAMGKRHNENVEALKKDWNSFITTAKDRNQQNVDAIKKDWDNFTKGFNGIMTGIGNKARDVWEGMKKAAQPALDFINDAMSKLKGFADGVGKAFTSIYNAIKGLANIPGVKEILASLAAVTGGGTGGSGPMFNVGKYNAVNPDGSPVNDLDNLDPHHDYQQTSRGKVADFTLSQGGNKSVPVPSPVSGTATTRFDPGGYGNYVTLKMDDGTEVLLAHFEKLLVKTGDRVTAGQSLGIQGTTGNSTGIHIHMEAPAGIIDNYLNRVTGLAKGGPSSNWENIKGSYYGGGEKLNKHTANGEVFDPNAMTAAHRSLPMGTIVEAKNPKNGKTVKVRINDRGPAASTGRSLDLSRGAAQQIGFSEGALQMRVLPKGGSSSSVSSTSNPAVDAELKKQKQANEKAAKQKADENKAYNKRLADIAADEAKATITYNQKVEKARTSYQRAVAKAKDPGRKAELKQDLDTKLSEYKQTRDEALANLKEKRTDVKGKHSDKLTSIEETRTGTVGASKERAKKAAVDAAKKAEEERQKRYDDRMKDQAALRDLDDELAESTLNVADAVEAENLALDNSPQGEFKRQLAEVNNSRDEQLAKIDDLIKKNDLLLEVDKANQGAQKRSIELQRLRNEVMDIATDKTTQLTEARDRDTWAAMQQASADELARKNAATNAVLGIRGDHINALKASGVRSSITDPMQRQLDIDTENQAFQERLANLSEQGLLTAENYNTLKQTHDLTLQTIQKSGDLMTGIFSQLQSGLGTALEGLIMGTTTLKEAFVGLLKSMAQYLAQLGIQSLIGGLFGGGLPGGKGGAGSAIASIFGGGGGGVDKVGNLFSSAPRLAAGGIVTKPTMAMIGEGRHSEAVIPLKGPLKELVNGVAYRNGAGGEINITNNITMTGNAGNPADAKKLGDTISKMNKDSLIHEMRPGGILYNAYR